MFSFISKTPSLIKAAKPVQNFVKMSTTIPTYETLAVTVPKEFVFHVELNRPKKYNAFSHTMWSEIKACFEHLHQNADCRVIIISGAGKNFTSGLDLTGAMDVAKAIAEQEDVARKAKVIRRYLDLYQQSISSLELCQKPVISATHGACIGAGVNLITAADIRYCTKDAWFTVKEVDLGMAADVGVLQRLPKVIGHGSLARELCFTARNFTAQEAVDCGLVSKAYEDKDSMMSGVLALAEEIAKKSPVAVQTTKLNLNYSKDHTVQESLEHMALYNQMMLQSEDFTNATVAQMTKEKNILFAKL